MNVLSFNSIKGVNRLSFCLSFFLLFSLVTAQGNPANCTFVNNSTNLVYDLSSLSISPNATLNEFYSYTTGDLSYFINICAPLNNNASGCSPNSTVCQNDNNTPISCGSVNRGVFTNYAGAPSTNS